MLNIHRFKLDKNAKSKTKNNTFYKAKTCFNSSNLIFWSRAERQNIASSFDFNSSQMSSKLFSLVPANYLILFLSMCACNLFNVRQAWVESHAGRSLKIRNKAVWSRAKRVLCDSRKVDAMCELERFLFIARRERNVWFHGSQTSGRRF